MNTINEIYPLNWETQQKLNDCANGIIDYIIEQMIMPRVKEDFGDDYTDEQLVEIGKIVLEKVKVNMYNEQ